MRPVTLVLVVHDHQPVGNFDHVFEQAHRDAYAPFLAFLESHPALRLGLHTSGPLLQWLTTHDADYLARLRALVERGQVELWGGAFFEPILPAIPEPDRRGQIRAMADWLELELGRRPRGLWLAERVWEPGLASTLAAAGAEYTAVDDAHFVAAGFERDELWGYFLTEDQGRSIAVFPIHRELRYRVPFGEPAETIDVLRRVASGGGNRIAMLGDDGEKFGVWPGTHRRCYDERWLERFVAALEAEPWIEIRTPAEALSHHRPLGLAYLPTASYHEMEEWSLPPRARMRYRQAAEILAPTFGEDAHDLLRGGHWRNFQARYPESNRIHKRMLRVSQRLWQKPAEDDAVWREARTRLWRAQVNCPYWHGVFGGLYLPHLRAAVYRELIAAEATVMGEGPRTERGDLDLDGFPDALIESDAWAAWTSARGGRLWALDDRARLWNYGDTLARHPEAYHEQLAEAAVGAGEQETIHAAIRAKQPGLAADALHYDPRGRDSFLDQWSEGGGEHDWALEPFASADDDPRQVVWESAEGEAPALRKRYRAGGAGLEVEYALTAARARRGRLAVEINLGLHVPEADDRFVAIDGRRATPSHFAARARHEGARRVTLVDAWADRALEIAFDRSALVTRAPIETVSLSEGGAERIFQGVELRLAFDAALEPSTPWRLVFRVTPRAAEAGR